MVFCFIIVKSIRNAFGSASCCRMRCSEKLRQDYSASEICSARNGCLVFRYFLRFMPGCSDLKKFAGPCVLTKKLLDVLFLVIFNFSSICLAGPECTGRSKLKLGGCMLVESDWCGFKESSLHKSGNFAAIRIDSSRSRSSSLFFSLIACSTRCCSRILRRSQLKTT